MLSIYGRFTRQFKILRTIYGKPPDLFTRTFNATSKRRFIRLQLGKCSKLLTISVIPTQLIYPKLHDEKLCKYLLLSGEEDRMLFESFFPVGLSLSRGFVLYTTGFR